jgi:Caspase domain
VRVTPWQSWDVEGPATHALVIGVSRYQHLPERAGDPSPTDSARTTYNLGQLRSPATGALRFGEWLRDVYFMPDAPKKTIRLLLSPSEEEQNEVPNFAMLGAEVIPATRENVEGALDDWQRECRSYDDNVGILYAGGHGIQLAKDGGIVLLEDFAESIGSPLNQSLDVSRVRTGMSGKPTAQRQFYFVDACRVKPEELERIDTQGAGIGLQSQGPAARCTPIYFGAADAGQAFGKAMHGTVFTQALIECLELLGVEDHLPNGSWYCSTTRLIRALEKRVRELAALVTQDQEAVPGGLPSEAVVHVLEKPPKLSLRVDVSPTEAGPSCLASLVEVDGRPVWERRPVGQGLVETVEPGRYHLNIAIEPRDPSYRDVDRYPAFAKPPCPDALTISVAAK